ncbi:hypothetical protein TNCV_1078971 [Trichonephila clavipes]|nr:hypothetical protein TNCV_1078971 [Trichonephila clavipes]
MPRDTGSVVQMIECSLSMRRGTGIAYPAPLFDVFTAITIQTITPAVEAVCRWKSEGRIEAFTTGVSSTHEHDCRHFWRLNLDLAAKDDLVPFRYSPVS